MRDVTKGLRDAGWNEDVERVLFTRKVGSPITEDECNILHKFFFNFINMKLNREMILNGIGDFDRNEIVKDTLSYILLKVVPKFDPAKYSKDKKAENYFAMVIWRQLVYEIGKRHRRYRELVSFDALAEHHDDKGDEVREPILRLNPQYDTNNIEQLERVDLKERVFDDIVQWYCDTRKEKGGSNTVANYKKILLAAQQIIKGHPNLCFRELMDGSQGKFEWCKTIRELSGLHHYNEGQIGNVLRRVMCYYARENYGIRIDGYGASSLRSPRNKTVPKLLEFAKDRYTLTKTNKKREENTAKA